MGRDRDRLPTADGFIDCWPTWTPLQNLLGGTIFWGPVVMTVLVLVTAAFFGAVSVARTGETSSRRRQ